MLNALFNIIKLFNNKEKFNLGVLFIIIIFGAFLELIGLGMILPFIAVVGNQKIIQENEILNMLFSAGGFNNNLDFLFALGVLVIVFLVLSSLIRLAIMYLNVRFSQNRKHRLTVDLYQRYLSQPYSFFLKNSPSLMQKHVLGEVNSVVSGILLPSLEIASRGISVLAIATLLFFTNPIVALSALFLLGLIYTVIYLFTKSKLSDIGRRKRDFTTQQYKTINESMGGIKDIKLYNLETDYKERFAVISQKIIKGDAFSSMLSSAPRYFIESLIFAAVISYVLFLIFLDVDLLEVVPLLGLYAFAGYRLMPYLQQIFSMVTRIKYQLPIVNTLLERFKMKFYTNTQKNKNEFSKQFNELKIENLQFRYNSEQPYVVDDVSFFIEANTTVGFVGATGSGKTTIVDIILGLLKAEKGLIKIDDTQINIENIDQWQNQLGYVPQSIYLKDDTIKSNIAFGVKDEDIDMDSVIRAAKTANIHNFIIEESENGYDSIVGDRGVRLSGGQRQRIGIARALYRNPKVLIMDEATSALDGITEEAIIEAIHNISHKLTVIMIAHRLSTVKECDKIILFEKGKIKDQGSYSELWERNIDFRKMAGDKK
jgi:ABC-type multidrug transport system fused ATPase/permease subunit